MYKLIYIFFGVIFFSCSTTDQKNNQSSYLNFPTKKDTSIRYAKRFSVSQNQQFKLIYLFGNIEINDTTAVYIILKDSTLSLKKAKNEFIFKQYVKKIASLSSVYTNMLYQLNELQHIVAIENSDYYCNTEVLKKIANNQIIELVKSPKIDVERTISLNPDIIFSFGMGNDESSENKKINQANIPTVLCLDHLEESPLARAEWIKFYAAFVGKETLADSIFKAVEKNYLELKLIASNTKSLPTVFTEIKYGDVWYVPAGKSFAATFLKDASASYVFENNLKTGSLNLSFEEVYSKAKDANFWLNFASVTSKKELLAFEPRYANFKAFKTGNLFNNNKTTNSKGYSNYWETGILYPNKVLSDLILIFHPEIKNLIEANIDKRELFYYKKLE